MVGLTWAKDGVALLSLPQGLGFWEWGRWEGGGEKKGCKESLLELDGLTGGSVGGLADLGKRRSRVAGIAAEFGVLGEGVQEGGGDGGVRGHVRGRDCEEGGGLADLG